MPVAKIIITDEELSDEILQLNSANFSLRVALIFLIVTVVIFAVMQLIKLIGQIWKISKKTTESLTFRQISFSTAKRLKLLYIQRTENLERNRKASDENQNAAEIKVVSHDETQNLSDELPIPDIQDSLAFSGNKSLIPVTNLQKLSSTTPISGKQTSTLPMIKGQDSLMATDNQKPFPSVDNAEQRNLTAEVKDQEHGFLPAKLQDSLMVVNSQTPLQPAGSAEQPHLRMASKPEETKPVQ
ncbi:unnamed protein product [Onchocerca ochengi]|uniref:Membrane associated protein n=1 Tax=Onchocerca ochengi TaxID=42157 RepID=A0A182EN84_ONCOC|nr:unnamed protein product [Onchocerca ochengi]